MIYIENILRLTYLLFIRKVLQDLQETIEFEIFGPSEIDETKNLDQIQNKGKLLINFLFLKSFKINNGKYRAVKSDALHRDPIYLLFPAHIHSSCQMLMTTRVLRLLRPQLRRRSRRGRRRRRTVE